MTYSKHILAVLTVSTLLSSPTWADDAKKAEVIHWWTSGGEAAAVKTLADAYDKAGGQWVDNAIAGGGGEAARTTGISRIIGGKPPQAMQFNYGKQFEEVVSNGYIANLDKVARDDNWQGFLPAKLWESINIDGHVYAVPINVHGQLWSWWSQAALEKVGAKAPPASWDELIATLDKMKAAGITPLALGGQPWQEQFLFDYVLNNVGGKELYRAVYVDQKPEAVTSPEFHDVVEKFLKLRDYVDAGSPGRNWNDATAMVIKGTGGLQIMGDWAKGEFLGAKLVAGKDFQCNSGLGDKGAYVYLGDVFVLPKNGQDDATAAQELLAKTIVSPETQVAFNNVKGSIPIRTDVDVSKMDACAQAGIKLMAEAGKQQAAADFYMTRDQIGASNDAVTTLWNAKSPDIDKFLKQYEQLVNSK